MLTYNPILTPLAHSTFIPRYLSPRSPDEWFGHLAFGHDLVTALCPSLYASIDMTSGDAYFGVCQTILEKGLECTCYGVQRSADELALSGSSGLTVYNAKHYDSFSHLLLSCEDPIQSFSNDSIGLLQISNNRRAGQIFETWLPKVKPGGFVLVDQITKRHSEVDAWRVWEHIENTYQESFAFHHADGLGVFRKPGGEPLSSSFLESLFSSSATEREYIRRHYVIYSGYLDGILRRDSATNAADNKITELTTELLAAQHERMILEAELTRVQLELTRTQHDRDNAGRTIAGLQDSLAAAHSAHEATRLQTQELSEALRAEQKVRQDLMDSLSWRLTAPVREFMEWKRGRKAH